MGHKRYLPGAFVRTKLDDGTFGYGRLRKFPYVAFYDFQTTEPDSCLEEIASKPVLFTVAVDDSLFDAWEIIGAMPLEASLKQPIIQFTQDIFDYQVCRIVDSEGDERPARPEECIGLERVAVWGAELIKTRLFDTFMGQPSRPVEDSKVRLE